MSENNITVTDLYFEQYKILVTSYEALQSKRAGINNFLVFMYSSIIGLYTFMDSAKISSHKSSYISIYCLAICVSLSWIAIIMKCIQSERVKYRMVQEVEANLPMKIFSRPYDDNYLFNNKILSTSAFELFLPLSLLVVFSFNLYFNLWHYN